ncbi:hypothetical protein [Maritalea porphyrae]|uniref:hypothetical protein n=1 Tax=Maritalea porphyrae TaxID=880732 RepID=UPI0022AE56F3|nr:hypothetical protein [Maritalea porphyrae]MCZ4270733.1 hypothetical protein [Maritalea porphyrae]
MLTLYGKTYAKTKTEFTNSLFNPEGTCNGFYKKTRGGVILSDMQQNERVFIRKRDGLLVTIRRQEDNTRRYMFATSTSDENWLGVPESYIAECDGAFEAVQNA